MTDEVFPFTLEIDCPDGRHASVVCLGLLRRLEKTRQVYDATWDGRPVIAKVFTRLGKARRHVRREWLGLLQLQARQLRTPQPLLCGRVVHGWAVVTEKIEGAVTARDVWEETDTLDEKENLLCRVAAQLALLHAKGVTQSDLHLGNFLVRGEQLYVLDPAMMRFRQGEIDRSRSIRQIALLTAIFSERAGPAVERVFRHYAAGRTWTVQPEDLDQLQRVHRRYRSDAIERGLRKFLRANRRHQAICQGAWTGLAERAFLQAAGLPALTVGLDEAMERGAILKRGTTSLVSLTDLGGWEVVIKRYNHKGLLHSLRHTLKGSRARRSWSNAHRLRLLGIETPIPLAYIDRRRGPFVWTSYIITQRAPGRRLHEVLHDPATAAADKHEVIDRILRLIDRLAEHGIMHGDMKATNLLCDADRIILTDLDSMDTSIWNRLSPRRRTKDIARFRRTIAGWEDRTDHQAGEQPEPCPRRIRRP